MVRCYRLSWSKEQHWHTLMIYKLMRTVAATRVREHLSDFWLFSKNLECWIWKFIFGGKVVDIPDITQQSVFSLCGEVYGTPPSIQVALSFMKQSNTVTDLWKWCLTLKIWLWKKSPECNNITLHEKIDEKKMSI